jgi:uncharacterized membrane protein YqhA
MFRRLLTSTRFIILIPVLGSLIASLTLLVYGSAAVYRLVAAAFTKLPDSKATKMLGISLIEIVDIYLLGTAFYIITLGLYELFIDDRLELPAWLQIHTFDDLKGKLIGVLVVVMSVLFLGQLVSWDGQSDLLGLGAAIALVIAALTFYLSYKKKETSK